MSKSALFMDIDGPLITHNQDYIIKLKRHIRLAAEICKEFNCDLIISSGSKDLIDVEKMESKVEWMDFILQYFRKCGITKIDITPTVPKIINEYSYIDCWKEDEIRLYLYRHPEKEHYCVVDDNDKVRDLEKVKSHLVEVKWYSKDPKEEGLLPKHKEEIKKVLEKDNEIKKYILRKQNKN